MNIIIELNMIYDEIKMDSYYIGETRKSENPDACMVQISDDDLNGVSGFIHTAVNDCCGILQMVGSTVYTIGDGVIRYDLDALCKENVVPILQKAILDYIVYYVLYMWIAKVRPDLIAIYAEAKEKAAGDIRKYSSMTRKNPVRRRSTGLGGI